MNFSRRSVLRASAATLCSAGLECAWRNLVRCAEPQRKRKTWKHGLSLFGDMKYPEGFKHFDYVNPQAPQGGTVRQSRLRHLRQFQSRSSRA